MSNIKAWEAFARYIPDRKGKMYLCECGVQEKKSKRLVCMMFQADDDETQKEYAALLAVAPKMRSLLQKALNALEDDGYEGAESVNLRNDIKKVLEKSNWKDQ